MNTYHEIHYKDSRNLNSIKDNSIHLIVTSPPYPMIAMWDEVFISMNERIKKHLKDGDGFLAFELMHIELKKTWEEIFRILIPGGIACINIGDATRKLGKNFQLYPNHAETIKQLSVIGFHVLPAIIWRKPSNSPTKFLGSGMLPGNAYVTLEHERILIFRKPDKREYKTDTEKLYRIQSSYFWEERNIWFSDIWFLNGTRQDINSKEVRKRSGAFPLEIPFRLINMFSSKLDTVFDPFLGTATTTLAALICGRNSIGYELDKGFSAFHHNEIAAQDFVKIANDRIQKRIDDHYKYIDGHKKDMKYKSSQYGFPVVTRQEIDIKFERLDKIEFISKQKTYKATHSSYQN